MAEAECGDDMCGEDPSGQPPGSPRCRAARQGRRPSLPARGRSRTRWGSVATASGAKSCWIEETGHIANYEAGAPGGSQRREHPADSRRHGSGSTSPQLQKRCSGPPTSTSRRRWGSCALRTSANIGDGATYSLDQLRRIGEWTRARRMRLHMDGAADVQCLRREGLFAAGDGGGVDSVSICFSSKGLGVPDGVDPGRDGRRLLRPVGPGRSSGGAAQAGIVAAAAVYALDRHVERLREDHDNARMFAEIASRSPVIRCEPAKVETNLVFFEVAPEWGTAADLSTQLFGTEVKINGIAKQRLRACTHLDVNGEQVRARRRSWWISCRNLGREPREPRWRAHTEASPHRGQGAPWWGMQGGHALAPPEAQPVEMSEGVRYPRARTDASYAPSTTRGDCKANGAFEGVLNAGSTKRTSVAYRGSSLKCLRRQGVRPP